jgi:hypothetical protein
MDLRQLDLLVAFAAGLALGLLIVHLFPATPKEAKP